MYILLNINLKTIVLSCFMTNGLELTVDGLPVVSDETFFKVVTTYPLASGDNDPETRKRIRSENPQIERMINLGKDGAPNHEARAYFEMGCQLTYEFLRAQSISNKK